MLVVHPSGDLYGSDRMAWESTRALVAAGWNVRVVLGSDGPLAAELSKVPAAVAVLPVPVLRKSALAPKEAVRLLLRLLASLPVMWRSIRDFRPDVVYVSTVTLPWWTLIARIRRVPVVCHIHEAETSARTWMRLGMSLPLLLATRVLTPSEFSRQALLRDVPRLAGRTVVIRNGVRGPSEPHPARPVLTSPRRLLVVGRISPRKGTDVAVRALGHLLDRGHDVTLDVVGDVFAGNEWFEAHVRELADQLAEPGRVCWLGVLPDVWGAMQRCDVVLFPSMGESFGNVAVEAMLAQRPLVASDTDGLGEVVRESGSGALVPPGDDLALADAVERVILDWEHWRARAGHARAWAEAHHAPSRYRREVADLLDDVRRSDPGTTAR